MGHSCRSAMFYITLSVFLTHTNSPLLIKENIVLVVSIVVSDSVTKIWYSIRPISHFDMLLYYWDNKTLRLRALNEKAFPVYVKVHIRKKWE